MSFLSDLFQGNFSNLGNDLAPSNIFSDFGTDASKAVSNPIVDAGLLVGGGLLTAGLADPALLGLGRDDHQFVTGLAQAEDQLMEKDAVDAVVVGDQKSHGGSKQ